MTTRTAPIRRAHDVHAHFYPAAYTELVERVAREDGPHAAVARAFLEHRIIQRIPTFTGALDERLRLMDAAGIATQTLSFASMTIWHPDAGMRARLVAAYNDGLAEIVAAHPDRFRLLASLPLPHVEEAIAEAARARTLPGFAGYSIPTHLDTVPLDDPRWLPVYDAMNESAALVLTHPDGFCAPGALADHSMEWAIGAPFEDTIATVRLVASGLLERFGSLTWVIPHLGGTVPFLLHRLLWRWRLEAELLGTPAHQGESLGRLLWDTANCSPATLRLALEVLPADRIVFGTDFPFVDPADLTRPVQLVRALEDDGVPAAPILADVLSPLLPATARAASPIRMEPR
jgi:predicted TIM-barrel fold metal-dependent hydrolase